MQHLHEKTIASEVKYEGLIFTVAHDTVELENGKTAPREVINHNGGVCVIPVTENNEIYLVRQFRYPFKEITVEIPAGKLEKGEDPQSAAIRELQEETGYAAENVTYIGKYYPTPGYCSEITYLYFAEGLSFVGQKLDHGEFVELKKIPLSELVEMVMNNEIPDAKTAIAILKADKIVNG